MASDEFLDSILKKDERLNRIEGVIQGCEEILSAPESNNLIRKCAIETAYKHIVKIMRGESTK